MADYWIKLYHEIIDDPKMATLPDRIWRRVIELFLLAGKLCPDKSGELPDTKQLAWLLRMQEDELQADLEQLAATGIVTPTETGWLIINFEKRQQAATSTERSQKFRQRKINEQYYGNETQCNDNETQLKRNVAQKQNRTEQNRTECSSSSNSRPKIFAVYEREIGPLTPIIADSLIDIEKTYPHEWVIAAFEQAARQNKRSLSYALGTLKNWQANGFNTNNKAKPNNKPPPDSRRKYVEGDLSEYVNH